MRRNNGFILVSVLISTTLLITAATAFAWFARTEAMRAASREKILKCRNVAEIAAGAVGQKIAADANGYDSFAEPLYVPGNLTKVELGNYNIFVSITPLNDRISVSGLLLPDGVTIRSEYETAWVRIWNILEHPKLAAIVLDFIDADCKQSIGGSERAGNINRLISDLSELKSIAEIDDGVLYGTQERPYGLARYLSVYGDEKININVASPEMIAMLDTEITIAHAQNLAAQRLVSPIMSLDDMKKLPGFPAAVATKLANIIGFESTYFMLEMNVEDKNGNVRNYRAVVERGTEGCRIISWEE